MPKGAELKLITYDQSIFLLESSDLKPVQLSFIDGMGRLVFKQEKKSGDIIQLTDLPVGIYFYVIEQDRRIVSGKLYIGN
jgi:hypothetical protein